MADSFFDKLFSKKPKKDEKPPPAPTPPPPAVEDAANGLKFLANPKKATAKRIEDAEKASGLKCGGRVKKLAFGGLSRSLPAPASGARPMMPANRASMAQGRVPMQTQMPNVGYGRGMKGVETQPVIRTPAPTMKKGGSVRGGGCATKGIGKGKMR